jgi:hypothetical protein
MVNVDLVCEWKLYLLWLPWQLYLYFVSVVSFTGAVTKILSG